jgi:predicted anti-sigma-YlaC factor YlaD
MSDEEATTPQPRHRQPPRPGEVEVPEWPSRWVGWILFAGVMMIVLGLLHAFQGFVALFDDEYYLVGRRGLAIHVGYRAWGWIHLALALVVLAAGVALLNGRLWGRVVAVVLSVLSVLVNAAFLAAYPIWSTIMIAVDLLVIWALTVHGHEMREMKEASGR